MTQFYQDDINSTNLQVHLQILAHDYPKQEYTTIFDIRDYMRNLTPAKKQLKAEVCTVLKLILVMPASNATSECSFSALRRVKAYLRSAMGQERLNNLMLLHTHKELTDDLDLKNVATEFISGSEHRLSIFGKF